MKGVMFLYQTNKARGSEPQGGGGALPIMAYTGRFRPKEGTVFTRISAYNASSAALGVVWKLDAIKNWINYVIFFRIQLH